MEIENTTTELRLQADFKADRDDADRDEILACHPDLVPIHNIMKQVANTIHGESHEELPRVFGNYELLEVIGEDGQGTVYRARDLTNSRTIALKRLDAVERLADLKVLHNLRHPNLVAVEGFAREGSRVYVVMEFVEGGDLKKRKGEFTLSAEEAGSIDVAARKRKIACLMRQIAEGVSCLHDHLILHRDIKPRNILIELSGRPRICDFDLLRRLDVSWTLTHPDAILGAIPYMAPEQAQAGADRPPLSVRSDIYSIGAVLYELLTGHAPFCENGRPTLAALLAKKLHETPPSPAALNPILDKNCSLVKICMKCLQLDPANRYASAHELADALAHVEEGKEPGPRSLWEIFCELFQMVKRPPAEPGYIERSSVILRMDAGISLGFCIGIFLLAWYAVPGVFLWLCFLGSLVSTWLIWWPLLRNGKQTAMELNLSHLWLASDLAAVCLLTASVPWQEAIGSEVLAQFYAGLCVIRGLALFVEGRMCWDRLYLPALVFFAAAIAMGWAHAFAPTVYGAAYAGYFLWLSFQDWRTAART